MDCLPELIMQNLINVLIKNIRERKIQSPEHYCFVLTLYINKFLMYLCFLEKRLKKFRQWLAYNISF